MSVVRFVRMQKKTALTKNVKTGSDVKQKIQINYISAASITSCISRT